MLEGMIRLKKEDKTLPMQNYNSVGVIFWGGGAGVVVGFFIFNNNNIYYYIILVLFPILGPVSGHSLQDYSY